MPFKRKPSPHQRQIKFFTFFFGAVLIGLVALLLWFLNWISTPGMHR